MTSKACSGTTCSPQGWRAIATLTVLLAASALLLTSCATSPPLSATRYKNLAHRAEFDLGASLLGNFDTQLRLDSQDVNLGTYITGEQTLGLGESTTVGNLAFLYRFNRRHHLDVTWQKIDRDGNTTLTDPIDFLGVTIPAVAVSTNFASAALTTIYTYNFAVQERWEVGVQGGLAWTDLSVGLSVNDDDLQVQADIVAPIPQMGLTGTFAVTPKLRVGGTLQWLQLELGDYQGGTQSARINLDYDILDNLGVGLGLVSFQTNADLGFDKVRGTLNYGYQGAFLFLRGML